MNKFVLDILFEDEDLVIVTKPAGLLTHPSWLTPKGTENVASMLKIHLQGYSPYTVHRLDRATSGVLVVAKNKLAAQRLSDDFCLHKIEKTYLCVVRGYAPDEGRIDHPLKYIHDKKAERQASVDKEAQSAITDFKRLACIELPISVGKWPCARYSLVQAMPKTGRKHQLRRHFKHILCPIVGDTNYGEGRHNRLFREHFALHRLLLMASAIRFTHPSSGREINITAPFPQQLVNLFESFGWHEHIVY